MLQCISVPVHMFQSVAVFFHTLQLFQYVRVYFSIFLYVVGNISILQYISVC